MALLDTPKFVDELPPRSNAGNRPSPVWAALRERPGRWALVGEAVNCGSAPMYAKTHPGFEMASRNTREIGGKKVVDVYARYVGTTDQS